MPNRITEPQLNEVADINIPEPDILKTKNGIPVYIVNTGFQEVMKVEFLFVAGTITENQKLTANAASELMDEGTSRYNSASIAEVFDSYGAYLQTECGADWSSVTLLTLSKFLNETLPLTLEIITDPVYPQEELNIYKTQEKQRLEVNSEKVDFLARRYFLNALYGNGHPYGKMATIEDFDNLNISVLKKFHENNYLKRCCGIIVAGKFDDKHIQQIKDSVEQAGLGYGILEPKENNEILAPEKLSFPRDKSVQAAIRIGKRMINRKHPDYFPFSILSTVLGGYFGSRLMSNIREDKGYTYGIGSRIVSNVSDGYFFIATEVGKQVCAPATEEIYKEINKLISGPVGTEELNLVKQYLTGSFQRSIDGAFALADRYKILLLNGLETRHYYGYMEALKNTGPEQLQALARQYLEPSGLTEVIVGN